MTNVREKLRLVQGTRPQLDMRKLEEAVHYIAAQSQTLGAIKLNKMLFYADMLHYAHDGAAITGATYAKQRNGPVPKQVLPAIRNLVQAGRMTVENVSVFDFVKREFTAYGETDLAVFSKEEVQRLDSVIRLVDGYTANEISDISHTIVWKSAEIGEVLPYETFFLSYLSDLSEEDMERVSLSVMETEKREGRLYA